MVVGVAHQVSFSLFCSNLLEDLFRNMEPYQLECFDLQQSKVEFSLHVYPASL